MEESFYDRDYFEGKRVKPSLWARFKLGRIIENHFEALYRAIFLKILFHPKKVLDVGCGMGELVFWLRHLGVEAFGVDISDYAISNAHPSMRTYLKRGSITNLPYEDSSFGLITTFDVLEHIEEKGLDRALLECQRVSYCLVLHKIFKGSTLFEVSDPSHVCVHPGEWWEEKFRKLGLRLSQRKFLRWEPDLFLLEARSGEISDALGKKENKNPVFV